MQTLNKENTKSKAASKAQGAPGDGGGGGQSQIKLGLDIHLRSIMVVMQRDGETPRPGRKMERAGLLELVAELQAEGGEIWSVYEACGMGFSLQRELAAAGVKALVIAPVRLQSDGRRHKSDKADARELCLRLDRYLAGNRRALAVIRVPKVEEERRRAVSRLREQLVRKRRMLENEGHALIVQHCYQALPRGWWGARKWKTLLLEEWALKLLAPLRTLLLELHRQIQTLTKELEESVQKAALPKGLGALTYAGIEREVCDWNRFKKDKQVSSYTGCCPSEESSGPNQRSGAIDRHGNRRLRQMLVEAVWRLLRFNSGYWAIARRRPLLASGAGKSLKKKMVVAIARQLAVDLWRLQTGRCSMEALGLKPAQ